MATAELNARLRPLRKKLVMAAERVFEGYGGKLPDKTQFARLLTVCGEATCEEEICNYLRYQASRHGAPWELGFAQRVIDEAKKASGELESDDEAKVEAWRLFSSYLTRAYTYEKKKRGDEVGGARGGHSPRATGGTQAERSGGRRHGR